MAALYLSPVNAICAQIMNNLGSAVVAGAQIFLYNAGTTTPLSGGSYTDSTGTTLNSNPIITLANGRLPAGIWVGANKPHKMLLQDAQGNNLYQEDNLYGINDPTAIQALLLPVGGGGLPGTGFGVEMVANAVEIYQNFNQLATAPIPVANGSQMFVAQLEGGALVGDGLAGQFYWNASSTALDNGLTVIRPTAVGGGPGRWIRIGTGGWLVTYAAVSACVLTGFSPAVNINVEVVTEQFLMNGAYSSPPYVYSSNTWQRANLKVAYNGGANGTSTSAAMTITGLPALCTPVGGSTPVYMVFTTDTNVAQPNSYVTWNAGVPTFYKAPFNAGYTSSGIKGIPEFSWTYMVS